MSNFKITTIHAFVAIDPVSGDEGIIAFKDPVFGMMPLVSGDEERFMNYLSIAEELCKRGNIQYRILRFDNRQDVTEEIKKKHGLV